jgi:hypothetical protein
MKQREIIAWVLQEQINELNIGTGKSAYEVAVDNGFVGTEQEWLASLKGEPGEIAGNLDGGSPDTSSDDSLIIDVEEI